MKKTEKKTEKKTATWADLDRKTRERLAKNCEKVASRDRRYARDLRELADNDHRMGFVKQARTDRVDAIAVEKRARENEALTDLIRRNLGRAR